MGERLRGTASGWSNLGVEEHQFDSWPLPNSTRKTRNRKPEQRLENKRSPTALASHGHLHTCKFHQGRGFLQLGRLVKWRCLSHWTFLRKPPPLSLQPCSCIPNVAEWRHTACCFGEGMHGFEGEGQPARNSLWSESEQPAQNARSLSCSPPSKRRSGIGGKPGPFALLTWFEGEPGGEQKGTSIKPEWGTCTFWYKASLRGWKLAQGEGLGHRGRRDASEWLDKHFTFDLCDIRNWDLL